MRFNRALLGIVGLLAIGGTSACGVATAAKAANQVHAAGVSVEVTPNRAPVGGRVAIRVNCADSATTATVTSTAFGTVSVQQSTGASTLLATDVEVPGDVALGTYDVTVNCHSGATASTKLIVINEPAEAFRPTVGPHTGGGFLAGRLGNTADTGDSDAGPAPWFAASGAVLALAAAAGAVTVRRRRHVLRGLSGR